MTLSLFSMPRNCFYALSYNFFEAPVIGGISASVIVYATAAVIVAGLSIAGWLRRSRGGKRPLSHYVLMTLWVMWFALVGMQTWHQRWFERRADEKLGVLSVEQKYLRMYKYPYEAARTFTSLVPPGSSGRMIIGPSVYGTIESDSPAYFMFPHLDIVHPAADPDYLIYFVQTPPAPPSGFIPVMIDQRNETSLWKRAGS